MARETKEQMKERLESEIKELREQRDSAWKENQELTRQLYEREDLVEEEFKKTSLYRQMERDLKMLESNAKAQNQHIKCLEEVRGNQVFMIEELQKSIQNKNNTIVTSDFEGKDSMFFLLNEEDLDEKMPKIEEFNRVFQKSGVILEVENINNLNVLKINYDTEKNKRGAGRKQKFVQGTYTLSDIEQMLKKTSAEEVAMKLGISRATFFRKLKRSRELGDSNKRFL
ncbi:MAG: hypothetical protein KH355_09585 [Clostridiales bacterium]|nr:hypothetical protein [Clostridiales bacterium]